MPARTAPSPPSPAAVPAADPKAVALAATRLLEALAADRRNSRLRKALQSPRHAATRQPSPLDQAANAVLAAIVIDTAIEIDAANEIGASRATDRRIGRSVLFLRATDFASKSVLLDPSRVLDPSTVPVDSSSSASGTPPLRGGLRLRGTGLQNDGHLFYPYSLPSPSPSSSSPSLSSPSSLRPSVPSSLSSWPSFLAIAASLERILGPRLSIPTLQHTHLSNDAFHLALAPVAGAGALVASRPELLGLWRPALLNLGRPVPARPSRRRAGIYYTPAPLADHLADQALGPDPRHICDPACGCGAILLAAARHLLARGVSPADIARRLHGMDTDPLAVELARTALWLTLGGRATMASLRRQIVVADAMAADWRTLFPAVARRGGFDAVIGNPPFLGQLRAGTARDSCARARLARRFPGLVGPYTDSAAIFLMLGVEMARPGTAHRARAGLPRSIHQDGGRVALVLPQSVLAARDAETIRRTIAARARVDSVWTDREPMFDAGVRVCVPVIRVDVPRETSSRRARAPKAASTPRTGAFVRRFEGAAFATRSAVRFDPDAPTWAHLLASDVPALKMGNHGVLGDIATATADFRDEYYGLRGAIVEREADAGLGDEAGAPRLVTSGLIDACRLLWGERPVRILKQSWLRPRLQVARLDGRMTKWAERRLVPKVLLATQTRAMEAIADERGELLPVTPVVTVVARDAGRLWHVLAVLVGPVASAWAAGRYAGAALSPGAIKLSAKQAMEVPLPRPGPEWDEAARLVRKATREPSRSADLVRDAGKHLAAGYGVGSEVERWWARRRTSKLREKSRRQ
ncbi:MAG: class I SAM-dependent DNA methyltransferase [Phycisphaerales bacterium]